MVDAGFALASLNYRYSTEATLPAILIMHGALDPYIAPAQSQVLHTALAAHSTFPRLEIDILPVDTHDGGQFEAPETMARVAAFLNVSFATGGLHHGR
jgi:hypothetical protein